MRVGLRRALLGATLLLLVAALGCGMTTDLDQLVAWRTAQGAGGAVLLVAAQTLLFDIFERRHQGVVQAVFALAIIMMPVTIAPALQGWATRSEEHTSELQSLMRISYAVFCLKKKNTHE